MKKVLFLLMMLLFASSVIVSCTADEIDQDERIEATDKEENCPPNDRNCNGIPDNEE